MMHCGNYATVIYGVTKGLRMLHTTKFDCDVYGKVVSFDQRFNHNGRLGTGPILPGMLVWKIIHCHGIIHVKYIKS